VPFVSRSALAGLTAVVALLGAAGCTDLDEASAAGITHDDVVSAMASQLTGGSALSYTATYQLTGGDTATVTRAQSPARTAYIFPGGRLIATPTSTVRCTGDAKLACTESTPDPNAAATMADSPLITPEAALAMLNTAALDPDVLAEPHDTTVAGRHANCLDLSRVDGAPTREFSICVTNEGALASFTATIRGKQTDLALTKYADHAKTTDFTLPSTAQVTDKRPK
jgi:hypothetical protein